MNELSFVNPAEIPPRFKVVLYGTPGTGKTIGACSAPGPILYLNFDRSHAASKARAIHGADKIRELACPPVTKDDRTPAADLLTDAYMYLRDSEDGADVVTVVLDTVGGAYDKILKELSRANTGKSAGLVTLENYGEANKKIADWVDAISGMDVNLVLIAHEQIDDQETELTRRPMTGGKKLPEQLMGKVDIVAYTTAMQGEKDSDPVRYVGQVVEGKGRRAKDGTGALGTYSDLDLTDWFERGHAALNSTPELKEAA